MSTKSEWSKQFLEIQDGSDVFLSVVFTWDLPAAFQRAVWHKVMGRTVKAGGPAVVLMPDYLADVADTSGDLPGALQIHNPLATRTSVGCIRRCPFCAVPKIEGDLVELEEWDALPIVCDNNLLACSRRHFDKVVDSLKGVKNVDFNQGLDARLLTKYHADRLAELDCMIRLALDHTRDVQSFLRTRDLLSAAGFPKNRIRVYVLIGFDDTPEDALGRLRLVREIGLTPFPMRYNPLDAIARDTYVAPGWMNWELKKCMRYWSNLRWFGPIPFEDFDHTK